MQTMILLGEGYEEVEAITVIDYLRRADIPVDIVSINEGLST
ncbi:MAG: DJ-1 family protein, partial [Aerococcus viridans]